MSKFTWEIGSDIAGYRLVQAFGKDRQGDRFLAEDPHGQRVVIHAIEPALSRNSEWLQEYRQWLQLTRTANHPRIVKILTGGRAAGRDFHVTEFLGLPSLKYALQAASGRMSEDNALRIVYQLAGILGDLHKHRTQPMVHRGLSPANILIDAHSHPVLTGLRWGSPIQSPVAYPSDGVSAELWHYLAPEQMQHRYCADPRADVYSLGAILYTLVTGEIPFVGGSGENIRAKKERHDFRSPETIVPDLSRHVIQIIRECLLADPARRPPSMKRLKELMSCGSKMIGGYRLRSYLGSGKTGEVFEAVSPRGHRVAVKLLARKIADNQTKLLRFYRGAKLSLQVSHPNVLQSLEVNQEGSQHFLATEYVQGENLAWLLQKHGAVPEVHALRIGMDIASGLRHIHRHGMVHRDVKPSNILVEPDGTAKISDLGFAKCLDDDDDVNFDLTQNGRALGTCQYIPPEQFTSAKTVDERGDVYSLGITLYVMLTGKFPFPAARPMEMLMDKAINQFRPARAINPKISDGTNRLIHWMIQADPKNRPQSAEAAWQGLRECAERLQARPHQQPERKATEWDQPEQIDINHRSRSSRNEPNLPEMVGRIVLGLSVLFVAAVAVAIMTSI